MVDKEVVQAMMDSWSARYGRIHSNINSLPYGITFRTSGPGFSDIEQEPCFNNTDRQLGKLAAMQKINDLHGL